MGETPTEQFAGTDGCLAGQERFGGSSEGDKA